MLEQQRYQLGLASLYEVGKSRIEAMGEAEEVIDIVRYYAAELQRNCGYARQLTQLSANEAVGSRLRPLNRGECALLRQISAINHETLPGDETAFVAEQE